MSTERAPPTTESLVDLIPEAPFYIPATGPTSRPRRTLKHGDCFAVLDSHGDIGATAGGPDGVFYADTRFISRLEMHLDGMQLLLLGSSVRDDNMVLTVDLTNPDMYFEKRLLLPKDTLHIVRSVFLWHATAYQRLALRNHGDHDVRVHLSLTFGGDFADIFEVRGIRRQRRGARRDEVVGPGEVLLSYQGLDGQTRRAALCFEPAPTRLTASSASFRLDLEPGERVNLFVSISCNQSRRPLAFYKGLLAAHRDLKRSTRGVATVTTSNALFNEILCRSMSDLYMLTTETVQGPYPYAGTPWYSTTFGRDGIITAMQMLCPARSCTRCAKARWRRCAKCRSASTTAASIRPRCSCCWLASTHNGPAIGSSCRRYGRRSRRRCRGSTVPAIPTATASSSTTARPKRG